jgi:hypothetical protein
MMKQILKAGPNQMETLRRLRTEAAAIDKDVTVHSDRIRQTRDIRIRFWFRENVALRRERRQNELSGTLQRLEYAIDKDIAGPCTALRADTR